MKRPLFFVCLLVVFGVWIHLSLSRDRLPYPDGLTAGERVRLTGQVTLQEDDSFRIGSVTILSSGNSLFSTSSAEQSDANPLIFQNQIICERGSLSVKSGRTYLMEGTFMPFSQATNPGEYDSMRYYRSLGVGGRLKDIVLLQQTDDCKPIADAAYRLRCVMKKRIMELLPGEEGEVLCALLIGDKTELEAETKTLYKRNGILHILSISSLHITILGMSLYRLLRKLHVPKPVAAIAGSAVLLFYGTLTGFSLSACRAIGMYLLRMFAEVIGRTYDMLTALGVLAAGMVLYRPYYLENAGFLLSFASVLGIGVLYPVLLEYFESNKAPPRRGLVEGLFVRFSKGVGQTILASLSITISTLPIQLWFYYEIPVYSTILNLFVLPFLAILLVSGFLCLLPFCGFLAVIPYCILRYYNLLCCLFDGLPFRNWTPGRISVLSLWLYYGLLFGFLWLRKRKLSGQHNSEKIERTVYRFAFVLPVLGFVILILLQRHSNKIIFLDVGQGSCTLFMNESGEAYLFDCGSSSRRRIAEYVLLPAMKYYGIDTLDGIFLSHPDSDHTNGFEELLSIMEEKNIAVKRLLLPAAGEKQTQKLFASVYEAVSLYAPELPITYVCTGECMTGKNTYYEILHPSEDFYADDTNEYSLCLYIAMGNRTILLTGDVAGEGERRLMEQLKKREISHISILQIAHHGSAFSTSEEYLALVHPEAAIISAGRNNRYKHPHEALLERLEKTDSAIYRTDRQGAIEIVADNKKLHIKIFLRE